MSNILSSINTAVGIGNLLGREYNTFKASTEENPEKRKLYNARQVCLDKYNWSTFKTSMIAILLPILLLVLIISADTFFEITKKNKSYGMYMYPPFALWIFGGCIYVWYKSTFVWGIDRARMNMAEDIDMDTCTIRK